MSIFGKIKDAIFGHKAQAAPAGTAPTAAPAATAPPPVASQTATTPSPGQPAVPTPSPLSDVDVEQNLTELAAGKTLNWRTSIVDLMKLLGIDSSLDNRKQLAEELGYTGELNGSADMNIWLHKATMRELAKNGGKVPADLLD